MTARRIRWGVSIIVGAIIALSAGIPISQQVIDEEGGVCESGTICWVFYEPKGFPMDSWYGSTPNESASVRAERVWCDYMASEFVLYYQQQTGYTMDLDCVYAKGQMDSYQLAQYYCSGEPCGTALDGKTGGAIVGGQGINANQVLNEAMNKELGLFDQGQDHQRIVVMVPNGGGWAGGSSDSVPMMVDKPARTRGWAIIGDWKFTYYMRMLIGWNEPDPVCLEIAGLGSCTDHVMHAPLHEGCHSLGHWGCHNSADPCCPSIGYGVNLNDEDKRQFPIYNWAFVTPVDPAIPTPTETSKPPEITPPSPPTDTPTFTPTETPVPTKTPKPPCHPPQSRRCRGR